MARRLFVTVPDESWERRLSGLSGTVTITAWDLTGPPPRDAIDLVVLPYGSADRLSALETVTTGLVQTLSVGYDAVAPTLPAGHRLANGASVHETATAELAVTLVLAAQRRIPAYIEAARSGEWDELDRAEGLADRRVLLIGYGEIGKGIERRIAPFEASITRVATTARTEDGRVVHGIDELGDLLAEAEIAIVSLPLNDSTRGVIGSEALGLLPDGALLVNVGRGPVVDTAALTDAVASGRIRAAIDVVDPEPLPADHALWSLPGALLTPHVGGFTEAGPRRETALVERQIRLLSAGLSPANVVLDTRAAAEPRS